MALAGKGKGSPTEISIWKFSQGFKRINQLLPGQVRADHSGHFGKDLDIRITRG